MSTRRASDAPWNGGLRAMDGLTVFVESEHGERDVLVRACMPLRGALVSVARELDKRPDRWRVTCIASPTTILSDLRGRVHAHAHGDGEHHANPDAHYLGKIGRADLLSF